MNIDILNEKKNDLHLKTEFIYRIKNLGEEKMIACTTYTRAL